LGLFLCPHWEPDLRVNARATSVFIPCISFPVPTEGPFLPATKPTLRVDSQT